MNRQVWLFRLRYLFTFLWLCVSLLPVTVTAASPERAELASRFGGTYRRPLRDNPSTLDPARATDIYAYMVVNQLFDGLVQFDSHLNPVPALAGFWKASHDGLTWTFYLHKGVKFHNGREVTADDCVYSFTRILDPATQSPAAGHFKHLRGAAEFQAGKVSRVEGLQALDRYTLQIAFTEPYAPFLSILAMANAKIVPREAVEKSAEQFGQHPVGSGPFMFQHWEHKRQIVLQAYQDYHEGRPYLDRLVFPIGQQEMESFDTFLKGELEESIVPSTKVGELRGNPDYRAYTHLRKPALHLLYIGFNMRKEPFTHRKVRQAFNYAINKEVIVREIRKGNSNLARGILPPGMPGYDPELEGYYYNPERARQLLAEAGYPGGTGLPVLDLWYSSKEDTALREMEAYRTYLADIGVTVQIRQAENWPAFKAMLQEGTPLMFRLGWHSDLPDPDNFLLPLLFSRSETNRTFYDNPRFDQLLEAARRETDYQRRITLYRDIEQLVLQDAPWISQHHLVYEYLYQPYVRGMEINSLGPTHMAMKKLWLHKPPERQARDER